MIFNTQTHFQKLLNDRDIQISYQIVEKQIIAINFAEYRS